jgi:hypothetical protein
MIGRYGEDAMTVSKSLRIGLATILLMGAWGTASASVLVLGNSSPGNASPGPTVAYLDIISFSNASTPTGSGGSVDDKWYFSELQSFYLKEAAVSFNFYKNFSVELFGPGGLIWNSGVFTTGNAVFIPYTLLASVGTYYIEVQGTGLSQSANYSGIGQIVPLPAAAWLLLSGVAGLGALARRRKVAVES